MTQRPPGRRHKRPAAFLDPPDTLTRSEYFKLRGGPQRPQGGCPSPGAAYPKRAL